MPLGLTPAHLILILVIALIVVGPGKLPDVGTALGKSIKEFRKAASDVQEATSLVGVTTPAPAAAPAPAPVQAAPVQAAPMAVPPPPAPVQAAPMAVPPPAPVAAIPAEAAVTPDAGA